MVKLGRDELELMAESLARIAEAESVNAFISKNGNSFTVTYLQLETFPIEGIRFEGIRLTKDELANLAITLRHLAALVQVFGVSQIAIDIKKENGVSVEIWVPELQAD